jgi:hypothetical protein
MTTSSTPVSAVRRLRNLIGDIQRVEEHIVPVP